MPTKPQSQTDRSEPSAHTSAIPTMACYTGYETFPKPPPRVLPLTTFGKPKPCHEGLMTDDVSDLLYAQYRLSLLQWNAGTARRQPTQLVTAICGAFNAVLLQEAADHVPHVSDQFDTYTDGDNMAILLNKDTFLPKAGKYPIAEESTSKNTWGLTALVVRGHLRRPPIGAPKTITVCSVHLHNVVAKKRGAATSLLQRLYAHMNLLEVDFVGGDFNMAVRGPIADVFSDTEFMGPRSIPLWGVGSLTLDDMDCTGFICMLQRPFYRFVKNHGTHTFKNAQLGLNERDESTHYPVFMHLWATHLLGGTRAFLRSDTAQARRNLRAAKKHDRKRQRRSNQAAASSVDVATRTASAGQLQPTLLANIVTIYQSGARLEEFLTEVELARIGQSCHLHNDRALARAYRSVCVYLRPMRA